MRHLVYCLTFIAACAESQGVGGPDGTCAPDREIDDAGYHAPQDAGHLDEDDGASGVDATTGVDDDHDGLDDADEARWAQDYLPFLSVAPDDRCSLAVGLYRIRPHPQDGDLLHYLLILLFEKDCGASSHVGDNEVIGMTIDPRIAGPAGILAIRAISHQATPCEHVSDCSLYCGQACTTISRNATEVPVVFYSRNKHGAYLVEQDCDGACFLTNYCSLAATPFAPALFNAGEPAAPLIRNLTEAGAITGAAGWSEAEVFDFDPWGPTEFGTAGIVSDDLVDPAFVTPVCP